MAEKVFKFGEGTLMPVSFVIVVCGVVFFLSAINSRSLANEKDIGDIRDIISQDQKEKAAQNAVIIDRLGKIEGRIENLQHNKR